MATNTIPYVTLLSDMKTFDELAKQFNSSLTAVQRAVHIAAFCRMPKYGGFKWHVALSGINPIFVSYIKSNNLELYNRYYNYGDTDDLYMRDKNGKIVDVPHMFAVLQAFLVAIIKKEWFSWAGDLASSINPILDKCQRSNDFNTIINAAESYLFGTSATSAFSEVDLNADFDGEYIAHLIEKNGLTISGAIQYFYNELSSGRYMLVKNLHGGNTYEFDNYVHTIMTSDALREAFGYAYNASDNQVYAIVGTYISKIRRLS